MLRLLQVYTVTCQWLLLLLSFFLLYKFTSVCNMVQFGCKFWLVVGKKWTAQRKKLPTILPTNIPNADGLECTRVLEDLFNLIFLKINDEPKFFALASGSSDSISILHSSLFSISQYLIFIFLQGL